MNLQEKVLSLKLQAAIAARHARWWEKQIAEYGLTKVEDFYTQKLRLNHIERKAMEWEGVAVAREPRDSEKIALKGVAAAQDDGKAKVVATLLKMRSQLIVGAVDSIQSLTPATYHALVVSVPKPLHNDLRDTLSAIYKRGRQLVRTELGVKAVTDDEGDDELDDLTDLTDSRVANDVQSRVTAATARFAAAGLVGAALWQAVRDELNSSSTASVEKIATGATNRSLSMGRSDEAAQHDWSRVEYSAILDQNVCSPCSSEDGKTATDESDLEPAPNPSCSGGDYCRCFHVFLT